MKGAGEPLLAADAKSKERYSVSIGDIERSRQAPEHQSLWHTHTHSFDGAAQYDHGKKRKDNSLQLLSKRKRHFFRRNLTAAHFPAIAEAVLDENDESAAKEEVPSSAQQSLGVLLVLISTTSFSLAAVFVKLNSSLPSIETGVLRSVYSITFGSVLAWGVYGQAPLPCGVGATLALLIFRGFVDWLASNLYYFGCVELGLGLATVILFTNPFWAAILAKLVLGEPYKLQDFMLACIAFLGVIMSAWPSLHGGSDSPSVSLTMILAVFPCSIFQAATYVLIRYLAGKVHFMQMTVAYGFCGCLLGPSIMAYGALAQQKLVEPAPMEVVTNPWVLFLSLCVGCCAIFAQMLLNVGCRTVPASMAAMIRTVDIPLALIFQAAFFGQEVMLIEALGAGVVLTACGGKMVLQQMAANKQEDAKSEEDNGTQDEAAAAAEKKNTQLEATESGAGPGAGA